MEPRTHEHAHTLVQGVVSIKTTGMATATAVDDANLSSIAIEQARMPGLTRLLSASCSQLFTPPEVIPKGKRCQRQSRVGTVCPSYGTLPACLQGSEVLVRALTM